MTAATLPITVRSATPDDVGTIHGFIAALADYERLTAQMQATVADLREHLFGANPAAEVLIAEAGGVPVGFALWFRSFSTFVGRPGLWLEDLFVLPQWRGRGAGRALLARLAAQAVARGCGRLEWSVLDWNEPAVRFYRAIGAEAMDEWTTQRMSGKALHALAAEDRA